MKIKRPRKTGVLCQFLRFSAPVALGASLAHAVPVAILPVADIGVNENSPNGDGTAAVSGASSGNSETLNVRFSGTNRNEVAVLKFDLSAYNRAEIQAASVNLTNYKNNNLTDTRIWAVVDGAVGLNNDPALGSPVNGTLTDNTWTDDVPATTPTFSNTPSLEFDANSTTPGNLFETDVRSVLMVTQNMTSTAEGTETVFSSTELRDFLVAHEDDVVTFIVSAKTVNSGQKQFMSREGTTLQNGTPQSAGTYSPRLVIDLAGQRLTPVADMGFAEDTGNGSNSENFNARWNETRNDVIALRFDLTGVDRSAISAAEVTLTNFRTNTTTTPLHFYGVIDGSTGYDAVNLIEGTTTDDDWVEGGTTFATMPGIEFDADTTTSAVRLDRTVDLGEISSGTNLAEGTKISMASDALVNFLKDHPDDLVTVIVVDADGTFDGAGQSRYASKEATVLTSGGEAQPAGTFAPELNLLLGATPPSSGDFRVTEVIAGPDSADISLTWTSQPGETYDITYSTTLVDGFPADAATGVSASAGSTTTHDFTHPIPNVPKIFFRVEKAEPINVN